MFQTISYSIIFPRFSSRSIWSPEEPYQRRKNALGANPTRPPISSKEIVKHSHLQNYEQQFDVAAGAFGTVVTGFAEVVEP